MDLQRLSRGDLARLEGFDTIVATEIQKFVAVGETHGLCIGWAPAGLQPYQPVQYAAR